MRNKNPILPITSPELRRIISTELRAVDEGYYIIYCIITETGYPLQNLLDLKVSDLKDRDVLTVPASKRYDTEKQAVISHELQDSLASFLKDRKRDEYAFTSRFTGNQLHVNTFKGALQSVSRHHGIEPPVTVASLVKTYVYDQYIKGSHEAFTHSPGRYSYRKLHEFLGLDVPEDDAEYLKEKNPKTLFYRENLLSTVRNRFRETVKSIEEATERPDKVDAEYVKKATWFLELIDSAIDQFNKIL